MLSYLSSSSVSSSVEEKKKESDETPVEPIVVERSSMVTVSRNFLKSMKGGKKGFSAPIDVLLFSNPTIVSSAVNTALLVNTNVSFNVATFPELSSFLNLYDECRVKSVNVYYMFYFTTPSSAYGGGAAAVAINFDPSSPAISTIAGILQQAHNTGAHWIPSESQVSPTTLGKLGKILHLHAKMPGPLAPITSSDTMGSEWFAVDTATAPIIHNYQAYCGPLGALGVSALFAYYKIETQFRLRV